MQNTDEKIYNTAEKEGGMSLVGIFEVGSKAIEGQATQVKWKGFASDGVGNWERSFEARIAVSSDKEQTKVRKIVIVIEGEWGRDQG